MTTEGNSNIEVRCTKCGNELDPNCIHTPEVQQCPKCGCEEQTASISFSDAFPKINERLKGFSEDLARTGRRKKRVELILGVDKRKIDGKWMDKIRYINRDLDTYFERVVDPETGEVVHECDHPLTEHRGHGSDKRS